MVAKTMDDTTTYVDMKFQEVLGKNVTKVGEICLRRCWSFITCLMIRVCRTS